MEIGVKILIFFLQKRNNYAFTTGLQEKPEKKKLATLLTIIGSEALERSPGVRSTGATDEKTTDAVLEKFKKFYKPRENIAYERLSLLTRKQNITENIDDFAKDLRILAEPCEYGTLKESLIKDAFVLGVNDNKLRELFLKDSAMNL